MGAHFNCDCARLRGLGGLLIFDEATSNLDQATAEHFAQTVNQLRGKVTMIFIAHALPKGLQVDEVIQFGQQPKQSITPSSATQEARQK